MRRRAGISPAIVAIILAAGDLALVAPELPAGWFADRFGHRASLIVGSSVQVIGMLACWLGQGVPELIVAAVLVALGDAFRSGADEALLFGGGDVSGRRLASGSPVLTTLRRPRSASPATLDRSDLDRSVRGCEILGRLSHCKWETLL